MRRRCAASSHTCRRSSLVIRDHAATSDNKRPQPIQVFDGSSRHTPMHGDCGSAPAFCAVCDIRMLGGEGRATDFSHARLARCLVFSIPGISGHDGVGRMR
jgi:hypothetical protein